MVEQALERGFGPVFASREWLSQHEASLQRFFS